jgi:hypothetical protein
MPDSFQALGVLVLALLPGALYVWSLERLVGAWGVRLSDRLFRFVGVSAVLHAMAAPLTYRLWVSYVKTGRFSRGQLPLAVWGAALAYVALPIAAGSLIGFGRRRGWRWTRFVVGFDPPRAWDYLFGQRPDGWVLLRLKSGAWLGGAYASQGRGWRSYASEYPQRQDLFLVDAAEVDPETGEFSFGQDDQPVLRGSGILVRWDEVEYLEFVDA